jgi:hypothetical protein
MPPEERRSNTIGPKKGSFKSGVITFSERVITSLCIRAHAYAGGTRERIMGSRAGRRSGRGREAATKRVVINAVGSPTLSLSLIYLLGQRPLSRARMFTHAELPVKTALGLLSPPFLPWGPSIQRKLRLHDATDPLQLHCVHAQVHVQRPCEMSGIAARVGGRRREEKDALGKVDGRCNCIIGKLGGERGRQNASRQPVPIESFALGGLWWGGVGVGRPRARHPRGRTDSRTDVHSE